MIDLRGKGNAWSDLIRLANGAERKHEQRRGPLVL
jgi:hypothetical protein